MAGQPEGETLSGGDYSMQGGVAPPDCIPEPVVISLTCDGIQVRLDWVPDDISVAYDIYRATVPYFEPNPTFKQDTVAVPPWTDPTPYTCGDAATNYYYLVRGVCVGAHADANDCGEFDFDLVPGAGVAATQAEATLPSPTESFPLFMPFIQSD